jgi:hypothetical protein
MQDTNLIVYMNKYQQMEGPKLTESHSLTVQGQALTITDLNYCNRSV